MGFLSNLGSALFGKGSQIKTKQVYSPEDFAQWMQTVLGQAQPFLADLLKDYFGATAPVMGGTFGGQQGEFASQGVASQLPGFMGLAANLMAGQNQLYEKPGHAGLLGSMGSGFGLGLGSSSVPLLGKLLGLGGDKTGPTPTTNKSTLTDLWTR